MRLRSLLFAIGAFLLISSNAHSAPAVWKSFKDMEKSAKEDVPAIIKALEAAINDVKKDSIEKVTTAIKKITNANIAGTKEVSIGGGRKKKEDMSFFAPTLAKQPWVEMAKKNISEDIPDEMFELFKEIKKVKDFAYDTTTGKETDKYKAFIELVNALEKLPKAFAVDGFANKNKEIKNTLADYEETWTPLDKQVKTVDKVLEMVKTDDIIKIDANVISGLAKDVLPAEMLEPDDKIKNDFKEIANLITADLAKPVRVQTINDIFSGAIKLPEKDDDLKKKVKEIATNFLSQAITDKIMKSDNALKEVITANKGNEKNLPAVKAILAGKSKDKEPYTLAKLFTKMPKMIEVSKGGLDAAELKTALKNTFNIEDNSIGNLTKELQDIGEKYTELEKAKTELVTKLEESEKKRTESEKTLDKKLKETQDEAKKLKEQTEKMTEEIKKTNPLVVLGTLTSLDDLAKFTIDIQNKKVNTIGVNVQQLKALFPENNTSGLTKIMLDAIKGAANLNDLLIVGTKINKGSFDPKQMINKDIETEFFTKFTELAKTTNLNTINDFVKFDDKTIKFDQNDNKTLTFETANLVTTASANIKDRLINLVKDIKDIDDIMSLSKFETKVMTLATNKTVTFAKEEEIKNISTAVAAKFVDLTKEAIKGDLATSITTMKKFTNFNTTNKSVTYDGKTITFATDAEEIAVEKDFSDAITVALSGDTAGIANTLENAAKFKLETQKITYDNKDIAFSTDTTPKKISTALASHVANLIDNANLSYEKLVEIDLEAQDTFKYGTLVQKYLTNADFAVVARKVTALLNTAAAAKLGDLLETKTLLNDIVDGTSEYKFIATANNFNDTFTIKDDTIKGLFNGKEEDYAVINIKIGAIDNAVTFRGKLSVLQANKDGMPFKIIKTRLNEISTAYLAAYKNDKAIREKVDAKQDTDVPKVEDIANLDKTIKDILGDNRKKVVKLAKANEVLEKQTIKQTNADYTNAQNKDNEKEAFKKAVTTLTDAITAFKEELKKEVIGDTKTMDDAAAADFDTLYNAVTTVAVQEPEPEEGEEEGEGLGNVPSL